MILEIFCDASIKTFPNMRVFGCAGAIAPAFKIERTQIVPDSTNNKSEITAVLLAAQVAKEIVSTRDDIEEIYIYSDSKITVYGLREWMGTWLECRTEDGCLRSSVGVEIKNQDLYLSVINYLITNNLKIKLRHQKGHVNALNQTAVNNAARIFANSNGYSLSYLDMTRICIANDRVDKITRNKLTLIDPNNYPVQGDEGLVKMCYYMPPANYKEYIL